MLNKNALLLIDIQNDFCEGGSLAVNGGKSIIAVANRWIEVAVKNCWEIVATQDFHPADHGSFASVHDAPRFSMGTLAGLPQMMWPDHCVQGTFGAELHADLLTVPHVFCKGLNPKIDSYSGFFDTNKGTDTGLNAFLKSTKVESLIIMGLTTDYCVKATALDAKALGYEVTVILDGCRGVNQPLGSINNAIKEMRNAKINVL